MKRKDFLFRWPLLIESFGFTPLEFCLFIDYPISEYKIIMSKGRVPKKNILLHWLKMLNIPYVIFCGDIDVFANYLEEKCQNMKRPQKNFCPSANDWKTGLVAKNCMRQSRPRAMMSLVSYTGGNIGMESLNTGMKKRNSGAE